MPAEYLENASAPIQKRRADVEATVRNMLADITTNRDAAITLVCVLFWLN